MIFLTYDFVAFAVCFYTLYLFLGPFLRNWLIILSSAAFLAYYGGMISIAVVSLLGVITYIAALLHARWIIVLSICASVAALVFFKYTTFLIDQAAWIWPATSLPIAASTALFTAVPLGISFFTFEFVHYLTDVYRGHPPIRRFSDFLAFIFFWPTMVAGPIKRFEQFVPSLHRGVASPTPDDAMIGIIRVAIGVVKKWGADNLTVWIGIIDATGAYAHYTIPMRWLFVLGLAFRILLDFSGYSDMAIGFARLMGIRVPENFNWPYIARSPSEFWQRWHISLSSWIRDYVYIPLGGNRRGLPRQVVNALTAMVLCGLWHGPSWNFGIWGLYHGIGLALSAGVTRLWARAGRGRPILDRVTTGRFTALGIDLVCWAGTMIFVGAGWLLFFYPIDKALPMMLGLFQP